MPSEKKTRLSVAAYHHGDLKTALKEAALKLVREKGPRGFSLNEASRLAGVTVAAPYRHFEDKEALLAEIIGDGNRLLAEELRKVASTVTDVKEQMLEVCLAYLHFALTHADYFAVMFGSGIDKARYPDVQRTARDAFDILAKLTLLSEPSAEQAHERAVSCWALIHGLATLTADGAFFTATQTPRNEEQIRQMVRRVVGLPPKQE